MSQGGLKLEKALEEFGFSILMGKCAWIGASTGGFTDCLWHGREKCSRLMLGMASYMIASVRIKT